MPVSDTVLIVVKGLGTFWYTKCVTSARQVMYIFGAASCHTTNEMPLCVHGSIKQCMMQVEGWLEGQLS
jgi:hypothetical protein